MLLCKGNKSNLLKENFFSFPKDPLLIEVLQTVLRHGSHLFFFFFWNLVVVVETKQRALHMLGRILPVSTICSLENIVSFYVKQHLWGQSKRAFTLSCRLSGIP